MHNQPNQPNQPAEAHLCNDRCFRVGVRASKIFNFFDDWRDTEGNQCWGRFAPMMAGGTIGFLLGSGSSTLLWALYMATGCVSPEASYQMTKLICHGLTRCSHNGEMEPLLLGAPPGIAMVAAAEPNAAANAEEQQAANDLADRQQHAAVRDKVCSG